LVVSKEGGMSRRTKQQQSGSRRTRRAEQQPHAEFGFAETQRVVLSNPIFYCGGNGGPSRQSKPPGDQLRVVHDDRAAGRSRIGEAKPLPLPPCRAYHRGARVGPAPAVVVGGPHGRLLRRAHHHQHDPFLAAYVACSKSSGGENGARVKRKHEKKNTRKGEKQGDVVRGCGGIWEGWATSAKYAGAAMSCKNVCAVVDVRARDAPVAKKEAPPAGPTLDLSWAPVVLSARAMERRKEQR
jgi:hypothetical protein